MSLTQIFLWVFFSSSTTLCSHIFPLSSLPFWAASSVLNILFFFFGCCFHLILCCCCCCLNLFIFFSLCHDTKAFSSATLTISSPLVSFFVVVSVVQLYDSAAAIASAGAMFCKRNFLLPEFICWWRNNFLTVSLLLVQVVASKQPSKLCCRAGKHYYYNQRKARKCCGDKKKKKKKREGKIFEIFYQTEMLKVSRVAVVHSLYRV